MFSSCCSWLCCSSSKKTAPVLDESYLGEEERKIELPPTPNEPEYERLPSPSQIECKPERPTLLVYQFKGCGLPLKKNKKIITDIINAVRQTEGSCTIAFMDKSQSDFTARDTITLLQEEAKKQKIPLNLQETPIDLAKYRANIEEQRDTDILRAIETPEELEKKNTLFHIVNLYLTAHMLAMNSPEHTIHLHIYHNNLTVLADIQSIRTTLSKVLPKQVTVDLHPYGRLIKQSDKLGQIVRVRRRSSARDIYQNKPIQGESIGYPDYQTLFNTLQDMPFWLKKPTTTAHDLMVALAPYHQRRLNPGDTFYRHVATVPSRLSHLGLAKSEDKETSFSRD